MISIGNTDICAVGAYLPDKKVKTESIMDAARSDDIGISSKSIAEDLGIVQVRHADPQDTWSDLAAWASEDCLARTDVKREQIGLIIYTGIDGDYTEPSTAHLVQRKLGLNGVPAYDISNACQGFVTGIMAANAHIGNGDTDYVLVVTGECGSRLVDMVIDELNASRDPITFQNKMGVFTLGDAGGAILLKRAEHPKPSFQIFNTSSRGRYAKLCTYNVENGVVDGQMKMAQISGAVINEHKRQLPTTLKNLSWLTSDIDCLITHQVGRKPFEALSRISSVPEDRMTKTYDTLGNLTTATFPINLRKGIDDGMILPGSKVMGLFAGSGITVAHFGLNNYTG